MPEPPAPSERPADSDYTPTALPPTGARVLAFVSILVGGLCGGLIGWSLVDIGCSGDCSLEAGLAGLIGAVVGAVGVAVVATLALRAMGEWRTIQHRQQSEPGSNGPRR